VYDDRTRILELVLLATGAAAVGLLLDGAALWLAGIAIGALTAFGAFFILLAHEPRGVPIESLAMPAVAAMGMVGLGNLAGVGTFTIPALLAGAALLTLTLVVERRLAPSSGEVAEGRRNLLQQSSILVAFAAFTAVAGAVPGGLAEPPGGVAPLPLDQRAIVLLTVGDAVVAFLLGYRLAALRVTRVRDAAFAAGTFAVVVGIAAAVLRALALPRLVGPAVLAAVFAIWAAYRAAPGSERRSFAWLWEYGILVAAAAVAVAWNLLLH
jgi:hypothetical protein